MADASLAFWEAAQAQRVCAQCGDPTRNFDAHHVVEKQELKRRKRSLWDPRNALRLCNVVPGGCHPQHTGAGKRVELKNLTNENIEYAFETLGAFAYDYLHRRYDGEDPRLDEWLRVYERQDVFAA